MLWFLVLASFECFQFADLSGPSHLAHVLTTAELFQHMGETKNRIEVCILICSDQIIKETELKWSLAEKLDFLHRHRVDSVTWLTTY